MDIYDAFIKAVIAITLILSVGQITKIKNIEQKQYDLMVKLSQEEIGVNQ